MSNFPLNKGDKVRVVIGPFGWLGYKGVVDEVLDEDALPVVVDFAGGDLVRFEYNELELVEEKAVEFQLGDRVSLEGTVSHVNTVPSTGVTVESSGYTLHVSPARLALVERPEKEIPFGTQIITPAGVTWVRGADYTGDIAVWICIKDSANNPTGLLGESAMQPQRGVKQYQVTLLC